MKNFKRWTMICSALVLVGAMSLGMSTAQAQDTSNSRVFKFVPRHYDVLVSIDVQRTLKSRVYKLIKSELDFTDLHQGVKDIESWIGFDFDRDLYEIVFAGQSGMEGRELVYIRGKFDIPRIVSSNKELAGLVFEGTKLYYWYDAKDGHRYGCFIRNDLLVVAPTESLMHSVIRASKNPQLSMLSNQKLMRMFNSMRSRPEIWVLAAQTPKTSPKVRNNPVYNSYQAGMAVLSLEPEISLAAIGETVSAEKAKQSSDALNGLLALMRMNKENPDIRKLAENVRVSFTKQFVQVKLKLPRNEVHSMLLREIRKQKQEAQRTPGPKKSRTVKRPVRR